MNKKIKKSYRFNSFLNKELQAIVERLKITEVSFVEMAIIEKIQRIEEKENGR